ncbi:MAG: hypothetical protein LBS62_04675 [Clostridiales bacterium]|nr:hypothetical protein [Clostridiales bacterium]
MTRKPNVTNADAAARNSPHISDDKLSGKKNKRKKQKIPLNLVYDYPVRWSNYKVLRDFVQNFYDSIGYREWNSRFRYVYNSGHLLMTAMDVSFSYEWLVPIGASTKRDGSNAYAGYFGEGFKLAALNALREYHWDVYASSSNWQIHVVKASMTVDNHTLDSLSYELERCKHSPNTTLSIYNINVPADLIESVMLSFFYPENVLFGEKIWESSQGAIYKRSKVPLPPRSHVTKEFGSAGIVFAAYQNLGSINVPLVFANHTYRNDDRDRKGLYDFDVISLIEKLVHHVDAKASAILLEYFRPRWYSYPSRKYDICSFYNIVSTLVRNLARSDADAKEFREKYPNLLVAKRIPSRDIIGKNRKSQALSWMRSASVKYRLVQQHFALLGYSVLEDECQKEGGFTLTRDADETESKYIKILEVCTLAIFGAAFFGYKELPACKIITNDEASWRGMANCFPMPANSKNEYGHKLRYRMDYIAIKKRLLCRGNFASAYSTYLHELCHVFGGDSSPNFSGALSEIIEIQLLRIEIIKALSEKWDAIDSDASA